MTTLPTMMATTAASIFATTAVANQTADFNNDGNIDAMDLITLTSALNLACDNSCPTDINQDGVTDTMDLNLLMGLWGPVPGWVPSEETTSDTPETEGTPFQRDPNRDMSWQNEAPVLLDATEVGWSSEHTNQNFIILGHSWGGILGIEYALKYQKFFSLKKFLIV